MVSRISLVNPLLLFHNGGWSKDILIFKTKWLNLAIVDPCHAWLLGLVL